MPKFLRTLVRSLFHRITLSRVGDDVASVACSCGLRFNASGESRWDRAYAVAGRHASIS